jgi:hypothetical protein
MVFSARPVARHKVALQRLGPPQQVKVAFCKLAPWCAAAALFLSALPAARAVETLGGGTVFNPAQGPAPSFGLGGTNMVLVKNWHFGTKGTVKNYADMNDNFFYHDQFGTINNGGKYGSNTVSPDAANAIGGQPIEGINSPPVRKFTTDSLMTFLTPLDKVKDVQVRNHNAGNGSFMAKWRLPKGGSLLGRDIVWETRVRMATPPYFWFALWTAGNKWKWDGQAQGAEQDLMESFGYDNGNNNTNYDGRFWHSNAVASPSKDDWNFWDWGGTMADKGIKTYDATQYHIWTWVYKKDNTYAMYVDGIRVQGGKDYYWTFGNTAKDEPIDMDFLFDAGWGHNQIGSVNKELPASAFNGKFYEWNYSRVYLSTNGDTPQNGPHILPGTVKAADYNLGGQDVAFNKTAVGSQWYKYTVQVTSGGNYQFSFRGMAPTASTFHLEDETGAPITEVVKVPPSSTETKSVTVRMLAPSPLSGGTHILKWVRDSGDFKLGSIVVTRAAGASATFVKTDEKTQGGWKGVYGADGYIIAADATKPPAYGTVTRTSWEVRWNGNGLTSDVRALQKQDGGANDRIAGQWGSNNGSYDIDCNLTDGATHQVALYGLDWDMNGRSQDIRVLDAASGAVLDTQELNAYTNGKYLVWNIRGHVIFRVSITSHWTNPALSGIFFDPAPKSARPNKEVSPLTSASAKPASQGTGKVSKTAATTRLSQPKSGL